MLTSPFVLEGDDPPEQHEIHDPVMDVPGGGPSRVELGELDIDSRLRIAGKAGFDLVEENLADVASSLGHQPVDPEGKSGGVDSELGHFSP
jgi:hypothetical protein